MAARVLLVGAELSESLTRRDVDENRIVAESCGAAGSERDRAVATSLNLDDVTVGPCERERAVKRRLPRIGVYTNKGVNMDKQGVMPDVAVDVTPDDWFRGTDAQLLKAVAIFAVTIGVWILTAVRGRAVFFAAAR